MTLSIGDGANDVAMIQEANIGCGLLGYEGSQAAMSADYAFGQFRFLTKLLIVHGRWSYQRVADMHSNFFYKNVIWTVAMYWFLLFNSFDATYLYQYTFILLCNLAFTSLPVIVLGGELLDDHPLRTTLTDWFFSFRPRYQRQSRTRIPSALHSRHSWSRVYPSQVLALHAGWFIPVGRRLLHSLRSLDHRSRSFLEWQDH